MWRDQSRLIDHDEEATWHCEECSVAREISTVDLHLNQSDTWLNRVHQIALNLDR